MATLNARVLGDSLGLIKDRRVSLHNALRVTFLRFFLSVLTIADNKCSLIVLTEYYHIHALFALSTVCIYAFCTRQFSLISQA